MCVNVCDYVKQTWSVNNNKKFAYVKVCLFFSYIYYILLYIYFTFLLNFAWRVA